MGLNAQTEARTNQENKLQITLHSFFKIYGTKTKVLYRIHYEAFHQGNMNAMTELHKIVTLPRDI